MRLWEFLCYCDKRQYVKVFYNNHVLCSGVNRLIVDDFEESELKVTYFTYQKDLLYIEVE